LLYLHLVAFTETTLKLALPVVLAGVDASVVEGIDATVKPAPVAAVVGVPEPPLPADEIACTLRMEFRALVPSAGRVGKVIDATVPSDGSSCAPLIGPVLLCDGGALSAGSSGALVAAPLDVSVPVAVVGDSGYAAFGVGPPYGSGAVIDGALEAPPAPVPEPTLLPEAAALPLPEAFVRFRARSSNAWCSVDTTNVGGWHEQN